MVDPGVLTWRFGNELVAYHLRTGRSYRLPSLPIQAREFMEIGGELEVPTPLAGAGGERGAASELVVLLEMLEQEQVVQRVGEPRKSPPGRGVDGDLFLIIATDRAGARGDNQRDAPAMALSVHTVLQRAPGVVVELKNNLARVALSDRRDHSIDGGAHALRLLDAFERPRTIQEVVRVLQGRAREVQGWIGLIESLVRLFEGGVLCDVKSNRNGGQPKVR